MILANKNDENFIAFCTEFRAYVEVHGLFPPKHTNLLSRLKYTRKKIKDGILENWKHEMFESLMAERWMDEHTGGRRKKEM